MTDSDRVAIEASSVWPDDADEDEGVVSNWFVREGAAVEEGDLLCEIQVEKVSIDVHAPAAGRLEIAVDEDEAFTPDDVLAWIEPA